MASEQDDKSFLNIGIPQNGAFAPLGKGRVGYYAIRNIDNDFRIGLLASRLGPNKLLAKTLLSQVEMGNVQLQFLDRQARAQGEANVELRNLSQMAASAHKAAEDFSQRFEVRMDAYVEETVRAAQESAERISRALGEGFDRTVDAIYENGELVVDAIGVATETLHHDLEGIGHYLEVSNETLKEIAKFLKSPGDTQVKELLERSSHLIDEGMKTHGKWRFENWRDALNALVEASGCTMGKTNPMVWFQIGFLTWKCNERSSDASVRQGKLVEARNAFDTAARLFTERGRTYYVKSIRHKAHMQYLLGDYRGALQTLRPLFGRAAVFQDAGIELARYYELNGMRKDALQLLEECIDVYPTTALIIFGEPDFKSMVHEMITLVARVREEKKKRSRDRLAEISSPLMDAPTDKLNPILPCGTLAQHKRASELLQSLTATHNFLLVHRLEERLKVLAGDMLKTNTSPLERARILISYGAKNTAAKVVAFVVKDNPAAVSEVNNDKTFDPIRDLIGSSISEQTKVVRSAASNELLKLERIGKKLKAYREEAGMPTEFCPEYFALMGKRIHVSSMNFDEATKINAAASKLVSDAFNEVRACGVRVLPIEKSSPRLLYNDSHRKGTSTPRSEAWYYMKSLAVMVNDGKFRDYCSTSAYFVALLYGVIEEYNTTHKLGLNQLIMTSENGLGSHWTLRYTYGGEGFIEASFFAPHTKFASFWRKAVPFAPGEHIDFSWFIEGLLKRCPDKALAEMLTAMQK